MKGICLFSMLTLQPKLASTSSRHADRSDQVQCHSVSCTPKWEWSLDRKCRQNCWQLPIERSIARAASVTEEEGRLKIVCTCEAYGAHIWLECSHQPLHRLNIFKCHLIIMIRCSINAYLRHTIFNDPNCRYTVRLLYCFADVVPQKMSQLVKLYWKYAFVYVVTFLHEKQVSLKK